MNVSPKQLPTQDLSLNAKGKAVFTVEQALVELGYLQPGQFANDSTFGSLTRDALVKFQEVRGLPTTGKYDAATRAKMAQALGYAPNLPANQLKLNSTGAGVRKLESQLLKLGYMQDSSFAHDGSFGTLTRSALDDFQRANGLPVSGTLNNATRRLLERQATAKPSGPTAEPAANYQKVQFRGVTVDVRTRTMLLNAEKILKSEGIDWTFQLLQGSFSTSVAASGQTHAGGGAADVSVRGPDGNYLPYAQVAQAVKALRMAGFAAWSRGFSDGTSFSPHIHMIAIGDKLMSSAARDQVVQYFHGENGLANRGRDRDAAVGRPYPKWADKYR